MHKDSVRQVRRFVLAPFFLVLLLVFAAKAPAADSLDLKKAVKVGSGKVMVIEFTDPDCPYCRRAEGYFRTKPQVTRYIYFLPLAIHPGSKEKVQYILSAQDKTKAYLEVVSGKFDNVRPLAPITPEGIRLQKEHQEMVTANHVKSTPTFMVYGRFIEGLDLNRLEPLLK